MWKCTCCEKENPDIADNCEECGHARFMDYIHHRTLSRISSSMEVNWKADRQTEKQSSKPLDGRCKYKQSLWQKHIT